MGVRVAADAWGGWDSKKVKKHKVAVYQLADGTYEAFAANVALPKGAVRMSPQPPFPATDDPYEGTRVVMKELESTYPVHIQWARYLAVLIAKTRRSVHSRDVWEELLRRGIVEPMSAPPHWMGAAMGGLKKDKILKDSGQRFSYSDAARGNHDREIKVWQLVEGADLSAYAKEPETKPKA